MTAPQPPWHGINIDDAADYLGEDRYGALRAADRDRWRRRLDGYELVYALEDVQATAGDPEDD